MLTYSGLQTAASLIELVYVIDISFEELEGLVL